LVPVPRTSFLLFETGRSSLETGSVDGLVVDKTGPVFASRAGGRLSHRNVERRGFDPAATDASLEGVTFHDLRHAYGSRLASKGLTARAIADAMGHKRTATTEIYIQRFNGGQSDENIRKAMTA
jgi:integrase